MKKPSNFPFASAMAIVPTTNLTIASTRRAAYQGINTYTLLISARSSIKFLQVR
jgi:hypothetical protein